MNLPHIKKRTLILMRHGHAAEGEDDFERPLTRAGESAALETATQLTTLSFSLEVILCSSAARAERTAQLVASRFDPAPHIHATRALYLAEPNMILTTLRELTGRHPACVLVVAHNPGVSRLGSELLGRSVWLREADYLVHQLPIDV